MWKALVAGLTMAVSVAAQAQDVSGRGEVFRFEANGLRLETQSLSRDQVRGFMVARGFSKNAVDRIVATKTRWSANIA